MTETKKIDAAYVAQHLPKRKPDGHKGDFGKLLVVGGSVPYTGAPYLTSAAAQRSGCGLVFLGVPEDIWAVEAAKASCAMPFPLPSNEGKLTEQAYGAISEYLDRCDALALGPGLGRSEELTRLVGLLLETYKPVVLDADGLNALSDDVSRLFIRRGKCTILTPHEGEFLRLGGDLSAGREAAAQAFAERYGCVLVLKGAGTVVAAPDGEIMLNSTGSSALSKGGSGDVLTGIIASLLAQGASPVDAAACGVWLHGLAGEIAAATMTDYAVTPLDVIDYLGAAFSSVLRG